MKIAVVGIGDELLRGFTINTNLAFIGRSLVAEGLEVERSYVVADTAEAIQGGIESALGAGCDLIITTGGLGPTVDDVTKKAVAEMFGLGFKESPGVLRDLRDYWAGRPGEMPEHVRGQAMIFENADYLPNRVGTAPGMVFEVPDGDGARVVMLPGPPPELNPMFIKHLLPKILSWAGEGRRHVRTVVAVGLPESKVEALTGPLLAETAVSAAYCASPGRVNIYLSGDDSTAVAMVEATLREALGWRALPQGVDSLPEALVALLAERRLTCGAAESCTAGLVAAAITDIPGSSNVLKGGVVVYSDELKKRLLGVPDEVLSSHGAVSRECAAAMVEGLLTRLGVDTGMAITGIAGPGGGTPEKPVGLVFISVAVKDSAPVVERFNFSGDRRRIRDSAAATAMTILRRELLGAG